MGDNIKKWLQRPQGIKMFGKISVGSKWHHLVDYLSTIKRTNLVGIFYDDILGMEFMLRFSVIVNFSRFDL